eukprot:scaffold2915_cov282-Prasinococcus_capsulatus_cf.AAC.2
MACAPARCMPSAQGPAPARAPGGGTRAWRRARPRATVQQRSARPGASSSVHPSDAAGSPAMMVAAVPHSRWSSSPRAAARSLPASPRAAVAGRAAAGRHARRAARRARVCSSSRRHHRSSSTATTATARDEGGAGSADSSSHDSAAEVLLGVGLLSSAMFVSSESAAWAQEHLAHAATANPPPPLDSLQLNQVASVAEFEGFWANAARCVALLPGLDAGAMKAAVRRAREGRLTYFPRGAGVRVRAAADKVRHTARAAGPRPGGVPPRWSSLHLWSGDAHGVPQRAQHALVAAEGLRHLAWARSRLFLKNPLGAMLVIGLVYGVVVGTKGALEVMLGLADSPF